MRVVDKVKAEAKRVTLVEWSAITCVVPSVWFICIGMDVKWGLILMFFAQCFWLAHSIRTNQLILGTQSVILNAMNVYGIYNWIFNNV